MSAGSLILVLPEDDQRWRRLIEALLGANECAVLLTTDSALATNAVLHRLQSPPPLVPILLGSAVHQAPAIAVGQRAAHRLIVGYVLVEPSSQPQNQATSEWPDARVLLATLEEPGRESVADMARLRNWDQASAPDLEELAGLITSWSQERLADYALDDHGNSMRGE